MPQVFTSSDKLREFAQRLQTFREALNESMGQVNGRLSHLSDTWKDQEFDAFREEFQTTNRILRQFTDEVERVTPLLKRDADAVDEYAQDKL